MRNIVSVVLTNLSFITFGTFRLEAGQDSAEASFDHAEYRKHQERNQQVFAKLTARRVGENPTWHF